MNKIKKANKFADALKIVRKSLRDDSDLYYGYQANIAMAFSDEYSRAIAKNKKRYINRDELHKISNNAAKNFLNLLIKD